jgi:hypothetical protein
MPMKKYAVVATKGDSIQTDRTVSKPALTIIPKATIGIKRQKVAQTLFNFGNDPPTALFQARPIAYATTGMINAAATPNSSLEMSVCIKTYTDRAH